MKLSGNLFDASGAGETNENGELVQELFRREGVRVERIVSHGEVSGEYDQAENEWVSVLSGTAELLIGDEHVTLCKGEHAYVPAHRRHRVLATSDPCVWLCLFWRD